MNCQEFQHRLSTDSLPAIRSERSCFDEHVSHCSNSACVDLWTDHQVLAEVVKRSLKPVPAAGLTDRVLQRVSGESVRPVSSQTVSSTRRSPMAAVVTLASVLMLAVFIGLTRQDSPVVDSREHGVAANNEHAPDAELPKNVVLLANADSGESYVEIAQNATSFVGDFAVLIVPGGIDETDSEPNRALEWFDGLEDRLTPVKQGVTDQLKTFWNAPST